jgi:hypothetical protein
MVFLFQSLLFVSILIIFMVLQRSSTHNKKIMTTTIARQFELLPSSDSVAWNGQVFIEAYQSDWAYLVRVSGLAGAEPTYFPLGITWQKAEEKYQANPEKFYRDCTQAANVMFDHQHPIMQGHPFREGEIIYGNGFMIFLSPVEKWAEKNMAAVISSLNTCPKGWVVGIREGEDQKNPFSLLTVPAGDGNSQLHYGLGDIQASWAWMKKESVSFISDRVKRSLADSVQMRNY